MEWDHFQKNILMEDNAKLLETLLEKAINYGQSSLELAKLKTIDKSTEVVSTMVSPLLIAVFVVLSLLFITLGVSMYLGEILGKIYYGMAIVAGFYALCALITQLFLRKQISKACRNLIIRNIFKQ